MRMTFAGFGAVPARNRVVLAPLSGITDLPFRKLVDRLGAGLVVSEMIASRELVTRSRESLRRAAGAGEIAPLVVQLAGREPHWMAEAARIAVGFGADVIDINMGCPAKKVVNALSGSALMREPDLALHLIAATVDAVQVPVTLKMRTGWDETTRTAPDLARAAEAAGIRMITVHGRTRCQFFDGRADWSFIRSVKEAVAIPVIANGDVTTFAQARICLDESGADGLMVGRGAQGRPWFPGHVAQFLETGLAPQEPPSGAVADIAAAHYEDMLRHYGAALGLRVARKHLGWYLDTVAAPRDVRARIMRSESAPDVFRLIASAFTDAPAAAA